MQTNQLICFFFNCWNEILHEQIRVDTCNEISNWNLLWNRICRVCLPENYIYFRIAQNVGENKNCIYLAKRLARLLTDQHESFVFIPKIKREINGGWKEKCQKLWTINNAEANKKCTLKRKFCY